MSALQSGRLFPNMNNVGTLVVQSPIAALAFASAWIADFTVVPILFPEPYIIHVTSGIVDDTDVIDKLTD